MKRILAVMSAVLLLLAFASSATAGELEDKLIKAAQEGHADVVRALLDKGADVNAKRRDGWTALMIAANNGHADVVHALLDKGADVNAKDNDGVTALMAAAGNNLNYNGSWNGHVDVIRALLDKGADVNAKMSDGWTASMIAAQNGHADVVKILKNAGAK